MNEKSKLKDAQKTEADTAIDPRHAPDYEATRAAELIQQAGAEASIRTQMCALVDWSQAPTDASIYVVRDDNQGNTKSFWADSNSAPMADAPRFFDVGIGDVVKIKRNECGVRPEPQDAVFKGNAAPATSIREGENPNSHNVSGYRRMSDEDVAAINHIKEIERTTAAQVLSEIGITGDARCIALVRTHMEIAFMFAVKAIAKPADPYR